MSTQGENNPIIQPHLVEQFEYDIEIVDNGDISQIDDASKLFINLQKTENTLESKKKKNPELLLTLPLKDIETAIAITVQTKHMMIKK